MKPDLNFRGSQITDRNSMWVDLFETVSFSLSHFHITTVAQHFYFNLKIGDLNVIFESCG